MDFLKAVKGTFGILTTDIGESVRHFFLCMYRSEMTTIKYIKIYKILDIEIKS